MYELPDGERFKVMYSGGEKHRKGVAFIIGKRIINSVLSYQAVSERHMALKVSGRARNILIHQIYSPNMNDDDEENKQKWPENKQKITKNLSLNNRKFTAKLLQNNG